jgi:predicted NUDIX family NTP pyrophosphohydrolase
MKRRISAGLVWYRVRDGSLEVFLAHPGGPLFTRRDEGYWTIPKGEIEPGEDFLVTALREFQEEVGIEIDPQSRFIELGSIRQKGGKIVHAWGVEKDDSPLGPLRSITFEMEWPPGSRSKQRFPEVDRAQFFELKEAKKRIKETQIPLLERLAEILQLGSQED